MKIENSHYLNFKSSYSKRNTNVLSSQKTSTLRESTKVPSSILKAYNLIDYKKGIDGAIIIPDYDGSQLIYVMKSPFNNTNRIQLLYSVENSKDNREAVSSPKNIETGEFTINIPILNRQNNSIIRQLSINNVEYFNDSNEKIGEETPRDMVIIPKDKMDLKEKRTSIIDGEISISEFDAISEGSVIGKLVKMDYEDVIRYKKSEPIIALLDEKDMTEMFMQIAEGTFTLPMNVKGLIMSPPNYRQGSMMTDMLGHAVSRIRGRKIFALMDKKTLDNVQDKYYNNHEKPYIKIKLDYDKMDISGLKALPKEDNSEVKVPKYRFVNSLLTPEDDDFTSETVGLKAYNLGLLKKNQKLGEYIVPKFFVVPSGVLNEIKKSPENADTYGDKIDDLSKIGDYHFLVQKADKSDNPASELNILRQLIINGIILPKEIRGQLKEKAEQVFDIKKIGKGNGCLIARSSFNGEDSDTIATQGLYDSFPGIRTSEDLYKGIKEVWASKWSDLAYMSRRNHKIPHCAIQPNVIVQEVVPVDYTFTINTADPRKNNKNKMVIQLSQGVYSCFPNSSYIFEYDKTTGDIERKSLATKKRAKDINHLEMDDVMNTKYIATDYSHDPLNMAKKHYEPVMKKIFDVASFIEHQFGDKPQDIEGGIIFKQNEKTGELEPEIHIWQTRDVHIIKRD